MMPKYKTSKRLTHIALIVSHQQPQSILHRLDHQADMWIRFIQPLLH